MDEVQLPHYTSINIYLLMNTGQTSIWMAWPRHVQGEKRRKKRVIIVKNNYYDAVWWSERSMKLCGAHDIV